MVAIFYQMGIIISIGLTGLLSALLIPSSKPIIYKVLPTSIVTFGWTIETLLLLRTSSILSNTQLINIWITFFVVLLIQYIIYNKNKKISTLQAELKKSLAESGLKESEQIIFNKYINESNLEKIDGNKHYDFLLNSIKDSTHSVHILSGWLSDSVIDGQFSTLLNDALKRGVDVYIGYGWQDFKGVHNDNPRAVERLKNVNNYKKQENYPGNIFVSKFPNHQKVLVIDNRYVVVGSANWLSNKAYKNEEYSFAIYSKELSTEESQRIEKLIKDHIESTKNT